MTDSQNPIVVSARPLPTLKGSYSCTIDGRQYSLDRNLLLDPRGHELIPSVDGHKVAYIKKCSQVNCHKKFFQLHGSYKHTCPLHSKTKDDTMSSKTWSPRPPRQVSRQADVEPVIASIPE